jgi:hypothetical protein
MRRTLDRRIIVSVTTLTVAALLFVFALARAVTVEPTAAADEPVDDVVTPVPPDEPAIEAKVPSEGRLPSDALRLAVDNDPFQADRRPPQPYRMPGDAIEIEPSRPVVTAPPPPPFKLLGTVTVPGSGLALMQVEETTPLVVNVGEAVMGYTLKTVDMTGATLASRTGDELRIAIAPPSPTGPEKQTQQNGRNGRGTRGNAGQRGGPFGGAAAAAILDRLRSSGAPPEVIDRMMQQLQQQGRGTQAVIEIGQPNRVIFRTRVGSDTLTSRVPDAPGDR